MTKVAPIAVNVRDDRYQRQRSIEGYVSHASIRAGETLTVFVSTDPAAPYRVDVYRMGYYGGKGGRHVTSARPAHGRAAAGAGRRRQAADRGALEPVVRAQDPERLARAASTLAS